ncbi:MAG TPA: hypothetical protein VJS42_12455 [Steroidobacteraceae bacterium]|nr:hypothetical protein [Steroidobacteraceae bacterium]
MRNSVPRLVDRIAPVESGLSIGLFRCPLAMPNGFNLEASLQSTAEATQRVAHP